MNLTIGHHSLYMCELVNRVFQLVFQFAAKHRRAASKRLCCHFWGYVKIQMHYDIFAGGHKNVMLCEFEVEVDKNSVLSHTYITA